MKTKIFTAACALAMAFQTCAFADYAISPTENILTVSGETEAYADVSFVLLNSDAMGCANETDTLGKYYELLSGSGVTEEQVFAYQNTEADANGKWSVSLPMGGTDEVNLTLVSNKGDCEYISYASLEARQAIIAELKTEAAKGNKALADKLDEYIGYISNQAKLYRALSDKEAMTSLINEKVLGLADGIGSLPELTEAIDTAIIVETVNEGKTDDFDLAMSAYEHDRELAAEITEQGKSRVLELLKGVNYISIEAYEEAAAYQIALQAVNNNVNSSAENVIKTLNNCNGVLGLDLSAFNALSSSDRALAASYFVKKQSKDKTEAQTNLNAAVAAYSKADVVKPPAGGGGGGSYGGGSGGIGSKNYTGSGEASVTNEYLQEAKYIFPDLEEAAWACDAVIYLNEKNIVKGYEDGSFRPNAPVTRAEFTKMVVTAFLGEPAEAGEGYFNDVTEDMWFAPYVNLAYKDGFVSGNGDGSFLPDDRITRQDMAVIILNAAKRFNIIEPSESSDKFSDDLDIADYAKEAVYTLKNNKIINGVGDGRFAPTDSANRAESAQIIYALMTSAE